MGHPYKPKCALPKASPPGNEASDREEAANFRPAGAPTGRGATNHGSVSLAEENAGQTSKSPEQSQNVIENKGSAADEVRE